MSQKKVTAAIIGLGSRGNVYAENCMRLSDRIEVVAVSDIIPEKMARFAEKYCIPKDKCYATPEEMLKEDKLCDVIFICTMDRQHYGQAMAALEKGYHLVLEKPISTDPKECMDIARLANEKGLHVIVCHVLRYSPFYRKLKEILDSGKIGRIMSIQSTEPVLYWHQAHSFVRGNWSRAEDSCPMILQKCCHDMDTFLWLTGKHCKSISSFGSLSHFKRECAPEGATERCSDACPAYEECPYSIARYLYHADRGNFDWPINVPCPDHDAGKLREALKINKYGRCAYYCDNDVVDHQVVNLLLEDDLTIAFTMCAFTAESNGRYLRIMGTRGEVETRMEDEKIKVTVFGKEYPITEYIDYKIDGEDSCHGCGDLGLVEDTIDLLNGKINTSVTSINDSVESHLICLAAEKSRVHGGELIRMDDYIKSL